MPSHRDPFPPLKYENDNTFTGKRECQKLPYNKPVHLAQNDQPWCRLSESATLASSRRGVFHHDAGVPRDSLDLHLKATYDHHQEFLRTKNQTLFQKETFSNDDGRILTIPAEEDPPRNSGATAQIQMWVNPQKLSIYSIKGTIGKNTFNFLILLLNRNTQTLYSDIFSLISAEPNINDGGGAQQHSVVNVEIVRQTKEPP
uniref:Si:ch211-163l21.7 n=1 Tax=Paramormyrops kingsleyae TaxID=1676925 RepID=A0A3B3S4S6_9TELE